MASKLDWKSFFAGMLFTLLGAALLGATDVAPPSGVGRFQIEATSTDISSKVYVVDTVNGHVWTEQSKGFLQPKLNEE